MKLSKRNLYWLPVTLMAFGMGYSEAAPLVANQKLDSVVPKQELSSTSAKEITLKIDRFFQVKRETGKSPILKAASDGIKQQYIVVLNDYISKERIQKNLYSQIRNNGGKIIHIYTGAIPGFSAKLSNNALEIVQKDPNVLFIEQDAVVKLNGTQNPDSWGLDRIDQHSLPLNNLYDYGWSKSAVRAYVVDTGIRNTHWDLGGRVRTGFSVGSNTNDCQGHGTHVAATISGNRYGVTKDVNLYPVKVFPGCSTSTSWSNIIAGINWIFNQIPANATFPAVANLSLGGSISLSLDAAITNLILNKNVTVIAAAGNNGGNACSNSPAHIQEVITVGASNKYDQVPSFSNKGSCVDIFAPGKDIKSAGISNDGASATKTGTSMAAPHVTGVAALLSAIGKSPANIQTEIVNTATPNVLTNIGSGSPNKLLYIKAMPPGKAHAKSLIGTGFFNPLYGVKTNGQLFNIWNDSNSQLQTGNILNVHVQPDSLALGANGDVFGIDVNGNIVHAYWNNSGWQSETINVWGSPAVVGSLVSTGQANPIYGVKQNRDLFIVWLNGTQYQVANILSIKVRGYSLVVHSDGSVFGVRPDGNIVHAFWQNGQWNQTTTWVW